MLNRDPNLRPTAAQILSHVWLSTSAQPAPVLEAKEALPAAPRPAAVAAPLAGADMLTRLRRFGKLPRMKRFALTQLLGVLQHRPLTHLLVRSDGTST